MDKNEEDELIESIIGPPDDIKGDMTPVWMNIINGISILAIIFFSILLMMLS